MKKSTEKLINQLITAYQKQEKAQREKAEATTTRCCRTCEFCAFNHDIRDNGTRLISVCLQEKATIPQVYTSINNWTDPKCGEWAPAMKYYPAYGLAKRY